MKMLDRFDNFQPRQLHCSIIGTTAALIAAGITAAGAVGGAAIAAHGANNAANAQANAANQAGNLQFLSGQNALQFQKDQFNTTQAQQLPFLQQGQTAMAQLAYLMGLPVQGSLYQPGMTANGTGPSSTSSTNPLSQLPGGSATKSGNGFWSDVDGQRVYTEHGKAYLPSGQPWTADSTISGNKANWVSPPTDPFSSYYNKDGTALNSGSQGATAGTGAPTNIPLDSLVNKDLGSAGSLLKPFDEKFVAPTGLTEQNDPGFQARLKLGTDALQKSAAARGSALTGGTAEDLMKFGSDFASNEYGNVYNRAKGEYETRYNQANQAKTDQFNRLAALLGVGQTSASTLNSAGTNYANNASTIQINTGNNIAKNLNNAAAARASGYVGSGNAWGSALNSAAGSASNLFMLSQLMKPGGGASSTTPTGGWDQYYGYGG